MGSPPDKVNWVPEGHEAWRGWPCPDGAGSTSLKRHTPLSLGDDGAWRHTLHRDNYLRGGNAPSRPTTRPKKVVVKEAVTLRRLYAKKSHLWEVSLCRHWASWHLNFYYLFTSTRNFFPPPPSFMGVLCNTCFASFLLAITSVFRLSFITVNGIRNHGLRRATRREAPPWCRPMDERKLESHLCLSRRLYCRYYYHFGHTVTLSRRKIAHCACLMKVGEAVMVKYDVSRLWCSS